MGLFGGKETYVSSVVYNMAGDQEDRIDYLKSVVAGSVIGHQQFSMSECLTGSYLAGPGIKIRSFHRWARKAENYSQIGIPKINIYGAADYDLATIQGEIPPVSGETHYITNAQFGSADHTYWADQYVMENYPAELNTEYSADILGTGEIIIHWETGGGSVTFTPTDFDPEAYYFYVTYDRRTASNLLPSRMWIYRIGSGNAVMDLQRNVKTTPGEFIPFIPIRMESEFISDSHHPEVYAQTSKAYRKASQGKKLTKLIETISDNDDLDDIDRGYIVYGVCLNSRDNAARKYLFRFFDMIRDAQAYDGSTASDYYSSTPGYADDILSRYLAQLDFIDDGVGLGGTSDPGYTYSYAAPPTKPITEVEVKSPGTFNNKLHYIISWQSIAKTSHVGLGKVGAKVGEVWWEQTGLRSGNSFVINLINAVALAGDDDEGLDLFWQKSATEYEKLTFVGLKHKNIIKNGKSVKITAYQALADEDESGFIVPIHYETMKQMSLVDSTQMMTSAAYLMFNCYEVVKQKWYQTWAFKIFIFIVVIALVVIFPPAGGVAGGILGSAAGVGAALGFTGLMATIVGAIANAIAAMILMNILTRVSTAVFGAKIGMIIATIASFVALSFGAPMLNGASMAQAWGNMMSAVNLLQLTSAIGNGISGYLRASTMEWAVKTEQLMAEYKHDSNEITRQWFEQFGYGNFAFDPNQLTNNNPDGLTEPPQMFLDRTLMTGSDIANISLDMITNFANMTLAPATTGS